MSESSLESISAPPGTYERLKLALAQELGEILFIDKIAGFQPSVHWVSTNYEVEDIEWPWVVAECERKLITMDQQTRFIKELAGLCYQDFVRRNNDVIFNQITAPWTLRGLAYFEAIGKRV